MQKLNSKFKTFYFLLVFLTFAFCFLTLGIARAQTPSTYDVTVSPVFFDLSTNPGSLVSDRIRVRNNTSSPLPIKIEVKRLTGDENGALTLKDTSDDNSLSWIKFESTRIVAKPLEWTNIPFKIEVPTSAAYGYYYAVSLTQDKLEGSKTTGATITGAAAIPILLNVRKEGARAEAKILKFSVNSYVNEYLPEDFSVLIENTGNVHIHPRGNIFITNGVDKNIGILDVNPFLSNIIPQTKKEFTSSWSNGFIVRENVLEDGQVKLDKNGKEVKKLKINWNKLTEFRLGKYTANMVLVYDNGLRDVPLEASLSFWIIPYKVIIGAIIVLVAAFFILRFFLRRYINREIRRRTR